MYLGLEGRKVCFYIYEVVIIFLKFFYSYCVFVFWLRFIIGFFVVFFCKCGLFLDENIYCGCKFFLLLNFVVVGKRLFK